MTPESDLRARVERGATFLDQAEPYWWKRVTEQVRMARCKECVLGQVHGDFSAGLDVYAPASRGVWAAEHGFFTPTCSGDYPVLDQLWLEAIEARRADPDRYVHPAALRRSLRRARDLVRVR